MQDVSESLVKPPFFQLGCVTCDHTRETDTQFTSDLYVSALIDKKEQILARLIL